MLRTSYVICLSELVRHKHGKDDPTQVQRKSAALTVRTITSCRLELPSASTSKRLQYVMLSGSSGKLHSICWLPVSGSSWIFVLVHRTWLTMLSATDKMLWGVSHAPYDAAATTKITLPLGCPFSMYACASLQQAFHTVINHNHCQKRRAALHCFIAWLVHDNLLSVQAMHLRSNAFTEQRLCVSCKSFETVSTISFQAYNAVAPGKALTQLAPGGTSCQ